MFGSYGSRSLDRRLGPQSPPQPRPKVCFGASVCVCKWRKAGVAGASTISHAYQVILSGESFCLFFNARNGCATLDRI